MDAVAAVLALSWFALCAAYNVVVKMVFNQKHLPILATLMQSLASLLVAWLTARAKIRFSKSDITITSASRAAVMLFSRTPRQLILLSLLHFVSEQHQSALCALCNRIGGDRIRGGQLMTLPYRTLN